MDAFSLASVAVILASLAIGAVKRFTLTYVLILGNLVVFFLTILSFGAYGPGTLSPVQAELGFRPTYLTSGGALFTLFTHMFVHSTIAHVIVNMLFLFLIGAYLESKIGKARFAAVYVVAGLAGVLLEALVQWGSGVLIVGASGAISGAMGALLILYPKDETPMFLGPLFLPRVPVWISVGSWFAIQVVMVFLDSGPVAYSAHIGGFLAGVVVGLATTIPRATTAVAYAVGELEPLATTPELRDALDKIRGEKEKDVRRAWLEYFADRAKCPRCDSKMSVEGDRLICECGYAVEVGRA